MVLKVKKNQKIPLVERFFSVQGEGYHVGRAAIFLRYAGCNLDCKFADGALCDTPWQKANEVLPLPLLMRWIAEQARDCALRPMVILTGGEPTIQPSFNALVASLAAEGYYVAVESNGTCAPAGLELVDWLVVSPKDHVPQRRVKDPPEVLDEVRELVHEYRYVLSGPDAEKPPYLPAPAHFVSPALEADGKGLEALKGYTPKFVTGAVRRCVEIVRNDPRWRLSLQTQKWIQVR